MPTSAPHAHTLLLIEDALPMAQVYLQYLADEPLKALHAGTGREALNLFHSEHPQVILLDLMLPDMSGFEILDEINASGRECTVIVITANGSVNVAVEAMQKGASDFLLKPFSKERLITTLRNAFEKQELSETVKQICADRHTYAGFIGSSIPMQAVYRIIDEAAPSKASVFITGESGTGKEVCAEAIHQKSQRAAKPFVALNCAAIPKDLMESEIFGHVKGAFTGALKDRVGAAEQASGGVLFLDEICEMDMALQAKLLRFLQTGTVQRVGDTGSRQVDVRIVCATNKSPWQEVEAGRFREDLYFRLHVIPLELPPLRERGDDIMDLARNFLHTFAEEEGKDFADFAPDVERIFRTHHWPGNVRELQNIVRNIVVLNNNDTVTHAMLPPQMRNTPAPRPLPIPKVPSQENTPDTPQPIHTSAHEPARIILKPMREVEWDYIQEALRLFDDNVHKAAALLDISPSTVYRRIREFRGT